MSWQNSGWICVTLSLAGCGAVSHPELQHQLVRMAERDQAARQQVFSTGSEVDSIAVIRMLAVDAANQDSLLHIIEAHGWPRKAQVGRRGLGAALLILQHADHPFQKRMLPGVRASFELGEVKGEQLALLTDRVLVGDGGAQRYGTQAEIVDGKVQFSPSKTKPTSTSAERNWD